MRILHVGKFYPFIGGVEKVMSDICLGISQKGIQCDILCVNSRPFLVAKDVVVNDKFKIMIATSVAKLCATMISPMLIIKLFRSANNYDIVHLHHPDPMAALALFFSLYKGKVITHWHSDILKQKAMLRLYKPLQTWLIKRSDKILGTTPVYIESSPFLRNVQVKCDCLPIGIHKLSYDDVMVRRLKESYIDKKVIFSLGRLVEYKGYKYLIDAVKYLPDDYIVLIGGKGVLMNELQEQILSNNIGSKVKLLGYLSDEEAAQYYAMCDLYCLSSIYKTEAFAIVQIEAMSCGKPIIATNIKGSGVPWVNQHGFSGINVEPFDAKALADGIIYLISDIERYDQYSKNAKLRFDHMFSEKMMINRCLSIYNGVL